MIPPPIDVIVLTKNSGSQISNCMTSISKSVNLCHLIVVDGGSTDPTLQMVKRERRSVVIDDSMGNRATARQKGIDMVDSEFFAFVDSDVTLCDKWHELAWRQVSPHAGAIWGVAIPRRPSELDLYGQIVRLHLAPNISTLIISRGGYLLHDTLIRHEAIRAIRIPSILHVKEDFFIGRYIVDRGYSWIRCPIPYCLHEAQESARNLTRDMMLSGQVSRAMNWTTASQIGGRMSRGLALWLVLSVLNKDYRKHLSLLRNEVLFAKGWLAADSRLNKL